MNLQERLREIEEDADYKQAGIWIPKLLRVIDKAIEQRDWYAKTLAGEHRPCDKGLALDNKELEELLR